MGSFAKTRLSIRLSKFLLTILDEKQYVLQLQNFRKNESSRSRKQRHRSRYAYTLTVNRPTFLHFMCGLSMQRSWHSRAPKSFIRTHGIIRKNRESAILCAVKSVKGAVYTGKVKRLRNYFLLCIPLDMTFKCDFLYFIFLSRICNNRVLAHKCISLWRAQ